MRYRGQRYRERGAADAIPRRHAIGHKPEGDSAQSLEIAQARVERHEVMAVGGTATP